ncbi:hypothetical protein BMT68_24890, partial [Escherichia coli]
APENHKPDPEWYCSSLCRETETLCQDIYERSYTGFISDATANGRKRRLSTVWQILKFLRE